MSDVAGLVVRVQEGDADAFGDLVARFADMAYGYAYAILKDFHLAEDAAQEAFVEAFVNLGKLREPAAFAGWFRRIVAGRCRRIHRGSKPTASLAAAGLTAAPGESPIEAAQRREIQETVLTAIGQLPEAERAATSLFYINGYSQKDIAEFLEVPVSTVKNRLHAARGRLREGMLKMTDDAFDGHKLPEEFPGRTLEQAFIARDVDQLLLALLPSLGKLRRTPMPMRPKASEALFERMKGKDNWLDVLREDMQLSEAVQLVRLIPHKRKLLTAALELLDKHPSIARATGTESGMTALHLALTAPLEGEEHELQLKFVRRLLEFGADPTGSGERSVTPLHYAAAMGNVEAATLLLDAGAKVNAMNGGGATPLIYAASHGRAETVRLLLERGADANREDSQNAAPLLCAATAGAADAVEALLDAAAEINRRGTKGWTPLYGAVNFGKTEVARLLLDRGADWRIRSDGDWTCVHGAAGYGEAEILRVLLDAGAEVDAKTQKGSTPLHTAAGYGQAETTGILLDRGADVNARGGDGSTPLHGAAWRGQHKAVKLLLDRGADPGLVNDEGKTPLDYANEGGHPKVARLLRKTQS